VGGRVWEVSVAALLGGFVILWNVGSWLPVCRCSRPWVGGVIVVCCLFGGGLMRGGSFGYCVVVFDVVMGEGW